MRTFKIFVPDPKKNRVLEYPEMSAKSALRGMTQLAERGFSPIAETTANGITERLTLQEMQKLA